MMQPLEPLDLLKYETVGDLVDAMSRCAFGARMLGEVAQVLSEWIASGHKPLILYNGRIDTPLYELLGTFVKRGWAQEITAASSGSLTFAAGVKLLVVDGYSERLDPLFEKLPCERLIFINRFGQAPATLIRDGHFPHVVFADPRFVIPILAEVLSERFAGTHKSRHTLRAFMRKLPAFGGLASEVADGAETLRSAIKDPDCTLCLTLSGAMTVAKMSFLICDLIDRGWVHYIASTGALMAHGLVEGIGLKHYKYNPRYNDELLAREKLNRVTDTLEPEENFDHIEEVVDRVLGAYDGKATISPSDFHRAVGEHLAKNFPSERGILKSAYEQGVPVCVPAFVDSEIGNDLYVHNLKRKAAGLPPLIIDIEKDTELLLTLAVESKRIGIFSIGGGVPRNNTQNIMPLIEIVSSRGAAELPLRKFWYGCRIDPTPLYFGNLSGSSYSEGCSWRKMDLSGHFSEIHADATIVWPFIQKYLHEVI